MLRDVNGTRLWVEERGQGEPIVFSHGLLWSNEMFAPQVEALSSRWRCIAYDHRGQGRSAVPDTRSVPIETVYEDAVALIESLGAGPVHFVGLSMGGFVAMRLAARRPDLVRSIVLLETAGDPEPALNRPKYRALAGFASWFGVHPVLVGPIGKIMFGRSFLTDPSRAAERAALEAKLLALPTTVVKAVHGVIEREGILHELPRIRVPTLVARGEEDTAIARERALRTHEAIPGSEWAEIPRAGHTSSLEQPEAVTNVIRGFLERAS
jgi:3-oxoadipate enol-lactonase